MRVNKPFLILHKYIEEEICNNITNFIEKNKNNLKYIERGETLDIIQSEAIENKLIFILEEIVKKAEEYYSFKATEILDTRVLFYKTGFNKNLTCKSGISEFNKNKKTFIINIFLNDKLSKDNIKENGYYGGEIIFLTHQYQLETNAGDVLVFPDISNFVRRISPITIGAKIVFRATLAINQDYEYDMSKFN